MPQAPTVLLNSQQIEQRIRRLAVEIYEDNYDQKELIVVGIANSGYLVAGRLCETLSGLCPIPTRLIEMRVNKDQPTDYSLKPAVSAEELKDKAIIIVDDVLNSGKTLMYSLRPFLEADIRKIRTVLLVNRDHKRYPVEADFVGITLSTTLQDHIRVDFTKGKEAIYLE